MFYFKNKLIGFNFQLSAASKMTGKNERALSLKFQSGITYANFTKYLEGELYDNAREEAAVLTDFFILEDKIWV